MYSAAWEPDGTATEADVLAGETFYSGSNNRTIKTGTATGFIDYSLEQYDQYDDNDGSDYTGEESTWTNTNTTPSTMVWYDTRTGLYWARFEPSKKTNGFTIATCDFFTTTPRGSYDGTDADCGSAINACGTLSLASTSGGSADTDWYLPSSVEIMEAYIDGIKNQASSIVTGSFIWSSTEYADDTTKAYGSFINEGTIGQNGTKTGVSNPVHCVRRD